MFSDRSISTITSQRTFSRLSRRVIIICCICRSLCCSFLTSLICSHKLVRRRWVNQPIRVPNTPLRTVEPMIKPAPHFSRCSLSTCGREDFRLRMVVRKTSASLISKSMSPEICRRKWNKRCSDGPLVLAPPYCSSLCE